MYNLYNLSLKQVRYFKGDGNNNNNNINYINNNNSSLYSEIIQVSTNCFPSKS